MVREVHEIAASSCRFSIARNISSWPVIKLFMTDKMNENRILQVTHLWYLQVFVVNYGTMKTNKWEKHVHISVIFIIKET